MGGRCAGVVWRHIRPLRRLEYSPAIPPHFTWRRIIRQTVPNRARDAMPFVLALDQGTTSSRAILFDHGGRSVAVAQREFAQIFPQPGWVEHDPRRSGRRSRGVLGEALASAGARAARRRRDRHHQPARDHGGLGPRDGRPIAIAIVWQDRRTAALATRCERAGPRGERRTRDRPVIDPYFSAHQARWLLDHVPGARARAERASSPSAPSISWLIWNLTGGAPTSPTSPTPRARCSSTFDSRRLGRPSCCDLFDVPRAVLPKSRRLVGQLRRVASRARRGACRSPASPATSRRRSSARRASARAWPRIPTAPAASCS